jgi:hypothetical protein
MPFTTQNVLGRFRSRTAPTATKSATKASSLFDAGQTSPIGDNDATFQSHDRADSAPVVNDPGETSAVPTFSAPVEPLGGSPGSFDVMDMGDNAPVGQVNDAATPEASGSGAGAADSCSPDTAETEIAPGQSFAGDNILGAEKTVDPKLYADALEAVSAVIAAEAAEPSPNFDQIDALADVGRTLSAPDDDSVSLSGLL